MLQKFVFVASPSFFILNALSCIFATSHVFIQKNALISTKMQTAILIIWRPSKFGTIPRAMYMDKENTLWKLSCVLLTRAKRAKCHAACKLFELREFFASRMLYQLCETARLEEPERFHRCLFSIVHSTRNCPNDWRTQNYKPPAVSRNYSIFLSRKPFWSGNI